MENHRYIKKINEFYLLAIDNLENIESYIASFQTELIINGSFKSAQVLNEYSKSVNLSRRQMINDSYAFNSNFKNENE